MRLGSLPATDSAGKKHRWRFWYESSHWMLQTNDGYVRCLESSWIESVYRIKTIADNYGMSVTVS